ncbi:hypothetical protein OROHE_018782 [Orobanche hederae]
MKMVAASKLRAIQTRAENSRGMWQPFTALLGDMPSVDVKKNVIVTVSSDKGLCGGINSTSVKISRALYKLNAGPEKENKFVIVGEKAKAQLVRDSKKAIDLSFTELQKNPQRFVRRFQGFGICHRLGLTGQQICAIPPSTRAAIPKPNSTIYETELTCAELTGAVGVVPTAIKLMDATDIISYPAKTNYWDLFHQLNLDRSISINSTTQPSLHMVFKAVETAELMELTLNRLWDEAKARAAREEQARAAREEERTVMDLAIQATELPCAEYHLRTSPCLS